MTNIINSKHMKRILLATVALFVSILVFGQGRYGADSAECIKYLSFYMQYMKQNNIDDAAPNWRNAIKYCPPTASQNMLLDGMKILRKDINKFRNNPIRKKELVDSLMMLHQMRIDTYPKYAVTATNNKAVDMMNYAEPGSELQVYEALGEALDVAKDKASTTVAVRYVDYAIQLYKSGRLMDSDVFSAFEKSIATLEAVKAAKPSNMVDNAISDVESLFAGSGPVMKRHPRTRQCFPISLHSSLPPDVLRRTSSLRLWRVCTRSIPHPTRPTSSSSSTPLCLTALTRLSNI